MLGIFRALLASLILAANIRANEPDWIPLFNGRDLDGWTVKVAKHPLGENYARTFRVEEGVIKVDYSGYDVFDMQVAHLFTNLAYANYRLRLEYRFVDGHREDAPFWARWNSGVMLHSQTPQSMRFDQAFPVSVEAQFLAQGTQAGAQTGNIATPGTHVSIDGRLTEAHIIDSASTLHPPGQWIAFEAEVREDQSLVYYINGEEAHRFHAPVLDPSDPDAQRLLDQGADPRLRFGHIALQAEGQEVWFRNIELLPLTP